MLRSILFAVALFMVWSSVWFQPDGITIMFPGLGGYHFAYAER